MPTTEYLSELSRIKGFSDGVFSIAITLLILEIKVPHGIQAGQLTNALLALWPSYLAYVPSFFTIGVIWINHHRIFAIMRRADGMIVAINLLLLLFVTWVSFPTALLSAGLRGSDERIAALIYSGTFVVIALTFNALWHYAVRRNRLAELADNTHRRLISISLRAHLLHPSSRARLRQPHPLLGSKPPAGAHAGFVTGVLPSRSAGSHSTGSSKSHDYSGADSPPSTPTRLHRNS
ncbi:MAG: TMEM175 family protein [Terriglobales bacterium]